MPQQIIAWKVSKYGVVSGPYFPAFGLTMYLSLFSPNAGKYGPEITPYLDTFHAVDWSHSKFVSRIEKSGALPVVAHIHTQGFLLKSSYGQKLSVLWSKVSFINISYSILIQSTTNLTEGILSLKIFEGTLYNLYTNRVHLPQDCRTILNRQITFNRQDPRSLWYSFLPGL